MLIEKHYKFIALKVGRSYDYFKSFDTKSKDLIFSVEMDEAMNFVGQSDEDIQYYLELVSEKIWQSPQYNSNSPEVVLLDMTAKVESNETVYKNADHLKMTAIKKLTSHEIEALGLEDLSLYQELKLENLSSIRTYLYSDALLGLMNYDDKKCVETFSKSNPIQSLILLLKGEV